MKIGCEVDSISIEKNKTSEILHIFLFQRFYIISRLLNLFGMLNSKHFESKIHTTFIFESSVSSSMLTIGTRLKREFHWINGHQNPFVQILLVSQQYSLTEQALTKSSTHSTEIKISSLSLGGKKKKNTSLGNTLLTWMINPSVLYHMPARMTGHWFLTAVENSDAQT